MPPKNNKMSISTKGGDGGKTSLMFGRRVGKSCARVGAYGAVDELSSALGMARAFADDATLAENILEIQRTLIKLMTELATASEDFPKLSEKKIPLLEDSDLKKVEALIESLESGGTAFREWQIPGSSKANAALNMARAICRRAERDTAALDSEDPLPRRLPLAYLNRLADLIFLWSCRS